MAIGMVQILTRIVQLYMNDLYLDVYLMEDVICIYMSNWFRKGWPMVLPFPGTGCLVPDIGSIYFVLKV